MSGLSVGVAVVEAPKKSGALITATYALEHGRDVFAVPGNADSRNSEGTNDLIRDCAAVAVNGWDILSEYTRSFPGKLKKMGKNAGEILTEDEGVEDKVPENQGKKEPPFLKLREPVAKKEIDKKNNGEYIDLERQLSGLTETQLMVVSAIDKRSVHIDDIAEKCCLPVSVVLAELTMLQLEGLVTQEKGKRFTLNIIKGPR